MTWQDRALTGKAGEALVAAELLRQHIDVAYPAFDGGVDLIAYRGHAFGRVVPVQIKSHSQTGYNFQKRWFDIERIVLVHVWQVTTSPEFYVFGDLSDVEKALGPVHSKTVSWSVQGRYSVTEPGHDAITRMQSHRNCWKRIIDRL